VKDVTIMRETLESVRRRAPFAAACAALAMLAVCGTAHAEPPRRISASLGPTYYFLDSQFFGLDDAAGVDGTLRYELTPDIYFENGIGFFETEGAGVSVDGLDYHLCLAANFHIPTPIRPIARLGVGLLSVNPVTVTPTESFRPTQTTFYLIGGAGAAYPLRGNMLVEAGATLWMAPFRYRIYRFNRLDVNTLLARFAHVSVSIGITYTF
jgi:hypothetical protein